MIFPTVDELLGVDREFRRSRVAVLHTARGQRRYTALFSISALAQRVRRERDWVIIELEEPGENSRWTVVTEWRGFLRGKRVVRGRELECFGFYRDKILRRASA
ncbi:MAG TPA: hypothetical protein VFT29_02345 [Gemmatimonadaceae bacterium]|nr:hypothetical protein [Gemmatimonadaceae bacterium]